MAQNISSSESHCSSSISETCRLVLSLASQRQMNVSHCSGCDEKRANPAVLKNSMMTAAKASFRRDFRGNRRLDRFSSTIALVQIRWR